METKFKSQICTDKIQSERLLSLGLKKETADMMHYRSASMKEWGVLATPFSDECKHSKCYFPAWSLHRLLCLYGLDYTIKEVYNNAEECYGMLICAIEIAIEDGNFNEEYLEKQWE